jgi:hypothetical protein
MWTIGYLKKGNKGKFTKKRKKDQTSDQAQSHEAKAKGIQTSNFKAK